MMYEIVLSEQAEMDLRGIYEYIAFDLLSPENAEGQFDRLEESIMELEQLPEKFKCYEKEPWHSRGMRIMPVDNYCVYYVPDKEMQTVTIIRVMYKGRDADAQLTEHTKI